MKTRLESRTLRRTPKFQSCLSHHVTGDEVSRALKGVANTAMLSLPTVVICDGMLQGHRSSVLRSHRCDSVIEDVTDRETWMGRP